MVKITRLIPPNGMAGIDPCRVSGGPEGDRRSGRSSSPRASSFAFTEPPPPPRSRHWDWRADTPQLKKLMTTLATGDVVVILAVDCLSRDTTDLLMIARDIQRAGLDSGRSPGLSSISRPTSPSWCLPCWGTTKPERRRIIERTARSRADATAKGVWHGRKPKLAPTGTRSAGTACQRRDTA